MGHTFIQKHFAKLQQPKNGCVCVCIILHKMLYLSLNSIFCSEHIDVISICEFWLDKAAFKYQRCL